MKTEKLQFHLLPELVAQQPPRIRSDSRLLVFNRSSGEGVRLSSTEVLTDSRFSRIGDFLSLRDCLVLNDTKVLPARFFGRRGSGGKLEGLFLTEAHPSEGLAENEAGPVRNSTTGEHPTKRKISNGARIWEVMLKGARKVKTGEIIYLKNKAKKDFCQAEVLNKKGEGRCRLKIEADAGLETILDKIGFPPLPPYIKRGDDRSCAAIDKLRYQTVYARHTGAIAAPTAGLHFTEELIEQLKDNGICIAYITLHVGTGTFKPITTENLEQHQIHQEQFSIDTENARIINSTKNRGKRIIAVGTTSARTLEAAAVGSQIKAGSGATKLFIKPGYKFKIVDAMITNFHLPKSTLLALVAAFAGLENILAAYHYAIERRYRFYSYGDAMLIL